LDELITRKSAQVRRNMLFLLKKRSTQSDSYRHGILLLHHVFARNAIVEKLVFESVCGIAQDLSSCSAISAKFKGDHMYREPAFFQNSLLFDVVVV
jgi:hypothetical protein